MGNLFALVGLIEGDDPLVQTDAQVRRRRTLDAIKRIVLRESLNQPLIVMFEDLHWVDEEAQALLNLLADSIGNQQSLDLGELPARVPRRVAKQKPTTHSSGSIHSEERVRPRCSMHC